MAGMTLEEFQEIRNTKAMYSVAGDTSRIQWEDNSLKT